MNSVNLECYCSFEILQIETHIFFRWHKLGSSLLLFLHTVFQLICLLPLPAIKAQMRGLPAVFLNARKPRIQVVPSVPKKKPDLCDPEEFIQLNGDSQGPGCLH